VTLPLQLLVLPLPLLHSMPQPSRLFSIRGVTAAAAAVAIFRVCAHADALNTRRRRGRLRQIAQPVVGDLRDQGGGRAGRVVECAHD
jgi:hypothetical protein